jgi:hypothetical protein
MKVPHFPRPRRGSARVDLGPATALAQADLERLAAQVASLRARLDEGEGAEGLAVAHLGAFRELADAKDSLDVVRTAQDLSAVVARLSTGSRMLAAVEAGLDGRPPAVDRDPCLFDPAHGPSTRETTWTSERHGTHLVPVCAADAALLEEHQEPRIRLAGGEPYWEAAPAYFHGWFRDAGRFAWLWAETVRADHR